jgi:hypothetical protein
MFGHEKSTLQRTSSQDHRVWVEAELKDFGDQALMRGWIPIPDNASGAVPI